MTIKLWQRGDPIDDLDAALAIVTLRDVVELYSDLAENERADEIHSWDALSPAVQERIMFFAQSNIEEYVSIDEVVYAAIDEALFPM